MGTKKGGTGLRPPFHAGLRSSWTGGFDSSQVHLEEVYCLTQWASSYYVYTLREGKVMLQPVIQGNIRIRKHGLHYHISDLETVRIPDLPDEALYPLFLAVVFHFNSLPSAYTSLARLNTAHAFGQPA